MSSDSNLTAHSGFWKWKCKLIGERGAEALEREERHPLLWNVCESRTLWRLRGLALGRVVPDYLHEHVRADCYSGKFSDWQALW